jgi:hypothetical protein
MKTFAVSVKLNFALLLLLGSLHESYGQQFSPWTAPVNVGPPVNTVGMEYQPFIAKDGLSLYFVHIESISPQVQSIYVAKRSSESEIWGVPQMLGPEINAASVKGNPFVTIDGHYMYFNANRPGGFGRADIYVSKRQNKREDLGPMGWQEAVHLGDNVNGPAGDRAPWVFEDETTGITYLYFGSDRSGNFDIYVSTMQPDGTFGPAEPVDELNTAFTDDAPTLSRDGLEIYFTSDRVGSVPYPLDDCCGPAGQPSPDIWVSRRASTSDPWGPPQNLDEVNASLGGPPINSPYDGGKPSLSFDGTTLYFFDAFREGNQSPYFDIWKTTRTKLTKKHSE